MTRGRIVKVWAGETKISLVRLFYVAIEGEDTATNAVLALHPEYEMVPYHIDSTERLSATAISFLEMTPGDIHDRTTEEDFNLLTLSPGRP